MGSPVSANEELTNTCWTRGLVVFLKLLSIWTWGVFNPLQDETPQSDFKSIYLILNIDWSRSRSSRSHLKHAASQGKLPVPLLIEMLDPGLPLWITQCSDDFCFPWQERAPSYSLERSIGTNMYKWSLLPKQIYCARNTCLRVRCSKKLRSCYIAALLATGLGFGRDGTFSVEHEGLQGLDH